jgi:hypothetical protein
MHQLVLAVLDLARYVEGRNLVVNVTDKIHRQICRRYVSRGRTGIANSGKDVYCDVHNTLQQRQHVAACCHARM